MCDLLQPQHTSSADQQKWWPRSRLLRDAMSLSDKEKLKISWFSTIYSSCTDFGRTTANSIHQELRTTTNANSIHQKIHQAPLLMVKWNSPKYSKSHWEETSKKMFQREKCPHLGHSECPIWAAPVQEIACNLMRLSAPRSPWAAEKPYWQPSLSTRIKKRQSHQKAGFPRRTRVRGIGSQWKRDIQSQHPEVNMLELRPRVDCTQYEVVVVQAKDAPPLDWP